MIPQFVEATSFSLDCFTKGKTEGRKIAKKALTHSKGKFSLWAQWKKYSYNLLFLFIRILLIFFVFCMSFLKMQQNRQLVMWLQLVLYIFCEDIKVRTFAYQQ